jgi:hypothetical protein
MSLPQGWSKGLVIDTSDESMIEYEVHGKFFIGSAWDKGKGPTYIVLNI